ncbi:MAG: hypothetical protein KDD99_16140, partial [Bacteroidetes bacterium]|nr:hypothetical protein [Bacteroidota bacterium]
MPSASNKPFIFLACPIDLDEGHQSKDSRSDLEGILKILHPFEKVDGCELLVDVEGARLYTADILNQISAQAKIAIVHLIGDPPQSDQIRFRSKTGDFILSIDAFIEKVSKFPDLQTVFLNGTTNSHMVERMLIQGVPSVITINDHNLANLITQTFYFHLLQGKSIFQAFDEVSAQPGITLGYREIDPTTLQSKEISHPPLKNGLFASKTKLKSLRWKLRNPLLIPVNDSIFSQTSPLDEYLLNPVMETTQKDSSQSVVSPPTKKSLTTGFPFLKSNKEKEDNEEVVKVEAKTRSFNKEEKKQTPSIESKNQPVIKEPVKKDAPGIIEKRPNQEVPIQKDEKEITKPEVKEPPIVKEPVKKEAPKVVEEKLVKEEKAEEPKAEVKDSPIVKEPVKKEVPKVVEEKPVKEEKVE